MGEHQKHIMEYLKELFDEFSNLKKTGIKVNSELEEAFVNLQESSGYDTYYSLVKELQKESEADADTIIISSDTHNVVDIVSHIQ